LAAAGCGRLGTVHTKPTLTVPPRASSTPAVSNGAIEARPPSGPNGTVFLLSDAGFQVGQTVSVEIDLPGGAVFKGQGHTVTPDRMVKATYRTSATDPDGTYQVKFSGQDGHADIGHFAVTPRVSAASPAAKAQPTKP